MTKKSFAIVGGGIGGLTAGIALKRKGFGARIFESAPVAKPVGAGIVLASNALKALDAIGIRQAVVAGGNSLDRFSVRNEAGSPLTLTKAIELSNRYGEAGMLSLHRADLHRILAEHFGQDDTRYGKTCSGFSDRGEKVTLQFSDGSEEEVDYVIAADGIHSVFRKRLLPQSSMRYSGYTAYRAVIQRPKNVDTQEASEWWGRGRRFGLVPLSNHRLYWYATINANSLSPSLGVMGLREAFKDFHSVIKSVLIATEDDDLIHHDICDFKPLPKYAFSRIVLLGDAAHATTPNLGQGACMAIEDAAVLSHCIASHSDPIVAFKAYEARRLERNSTVVNRSYAMGRIGQIDNPLLARLRNLTMRWTPSFITARQLRFLYDISFK